LVDIILYSSSNCFYDPRATIAFENYRTVKKGDLSEICARVSEMMPTCNNACPECIDAEESYGNQINSSMLLDRRLLIKLMEVIS
jgi:hypothetical protein